MAPEKQLALWELAANDPNLSFSPYVWRVRLALAHKGLRYSYKPWRFTEQELIAPCKTVPTLDCGDHRLSESLDICKFLDKEFPDTPALFNTECEACNVGVHFINYWADKALLPAVFPLLLLPVFNILTPENKKYFRESREAKFGQTLEEFAGDAKQQAKQRDTATAALEPLRQTLKANKWLGGKSIGFADITVGGTFMFAKAVGVEVLGKDDPVYEWRERLFQEFEGTISKNANVKLA